MAPAAGGNDTKSHDSAFSPGASLNLLHTSGFLVALIVFTICFEKALGMAEHALRDKKTYLHILNKVMKEFAILGFVSFGTLITIETSADIGAAHSPVMINFELAHLWIFGIGIILAVHAMSMALVLRNIKRKWDRMAMLSVADVDA